METSPRRKSFGFLLYGLVTFRRQIGRAHRIAYGAAAFGKTRALKAKFTAGPCLIIIGTEGIGEKATSDPAVIHHRERIDDVVKVDAGRRLRRSINVELATV